MQLEGAVAIVTGSSSGIGAAAARKFATRGCNVVVNYSSSKDQAHAVAAEVEAAGAEAIVVQGNVADDVACRALAQAAIDRWGRIDVLVNNAGATKFVAQDDLEGLSGDDFLRIYGVNVVGAYQMIRACRPAMKRQGAGAVVNVSSTSGLTGQGSSTAYCTSKAALIMLTKSLARVLGPELRINAICPGFVDNAWTQQMPEATYNAVKEGFASTNPLQRVAVSEDVADVIVWLSEAASLTTGEVIQIDAGAHLGFAIRTSVAAR